MLCVSNMLHIARPTKHRNYIKMSRRASVVPQTPVHNDDALERSMRRQQGSNKNHGSITDVARRVQDSPLNRGSGRQSSQDLRRSSQSTQVAPGDFEEWMKMVRMKRVKTNNAFAIQLIDAFHSMVQGELLSQDGQNVTFQEATHTLGGCLTVYKNRIARVKDDTSRLLVGVSENTPNANDKHAGSNEESDDDDDHSNNPGSKRPSRSKKSSGLDAYLAPQSKLEIDTNDLATSIDPLLRKMSADFDKRGAGALLQYSLKLDKYGRLLLDAEAQEVEEGRPAVPTKSNKFNHTSKGKTSKLPLISEEDEQEQEDISRHEMDSDDAGNETNNRSVNLENTDIQAGFKLADFNIKYFANVDFSARDSLPLVEGIARAVSNPVEGTDALIKDMEAWAFTNPGDSSTYRSHENEAAENDGQSIEENNEVLEFEPGFQGLRLDLQGGDFQELDFDDPAADYNEDDDLANISGEPSIGSIVSTRLPKSGNWMDADYLQKLDAQQTNWAGPSFWKIRRLHARNNSQVDTNNESEKLLTQKSARSSRNMASAASVIDFSREDEVDIDDLFSPGSRSTLLSRKQYDLQNKHLMPVDMHVTTKQLISLQLRPANGIAPAFQSGTWKGLLNQADDMTTETDVGNDTMHEDGENGLEEVNDDYFYGGWDDSPGLTRPQTASAMFSQTQNVYGGAQASSQLKFARVAKRVDVRRLKDNVWRAIHLDSDTATLDSPNSKKISSTVNRDTTLIKVIQDTQPLYSDQQRLDLSPAMYFISLLHLSNERGLSLENTESLTDIHISCNN